MRTIHRGAKPALVLATALLFGGAGAALDLHSSAEAVSPLSAGSRVPSVTVRAVSGEAVDLATLVAERGALLVFYRGGW